MRYNFIAILIICCVNLSAQEELKKPNYWYSYHPDSTENELSPYLAEVDIYDSMNIFDFNPYTHTISGDSLYIKVLDLDTREIKYEQKFQFDISDTTLVLSNGEHERYYKPLPVDNKLEIHSISFSHSTGGWYQSTLWTTIDMEGNVFRHGFDDYPDDSKTPSRLQKLLKTERADTICSISKNQIDSLKTLCKSTPIRKMKKSYGFLSGCDKSNAHLRIFHSEGVFVFDGMVPFEFLYPLYAWWRSTRKSIPGYEYNKQPGR